MPNIHGLNSMNPDQPGHHSSDSEDEDRQGFYVGGSERSGQEVLGPNSGDIARRLFQAARHAVAEQISPEEAVPRSSANTFQGGVYRLGGHGQEAQNVAQPRESLDDAAADLGRPFVVNFNVWENGFSIDDGPLREMAAPENRPFLDDIARGQIPRELSHRHPGRRIDLHMIRKNEPYVAPKAKPFAGAGHRLGGVAPGIVGAPAPDVVELDKPNEQKLKQLRESAQQSVGVRSDAPTARVQIRLPGVPQPLIATFNVDHTVTDVRTFIVNAQPNLAFQPFQLLSAYPVKVLEDEKSTLKEAGITNAVVNVKYV